MYKGWVSKKATKVGSLNKKLDCMTLVLFGESKENKAPSKDVCKIMVNISIDLSIKIVFSLVFKPKRMRGFQKRS